MARKPSPVLSNDGSTFWFVVQWLSHRFDKEELSPSSDCVLSMPVCLAIDRREDVQEAQEKVRASWRVLQKAWSDGWDKEYNSKLKDSETYFGDLAVRTNAWIDLHFPVSDRATGQERKRLRTAVRQQRMRDARRTAGSKGAIQVSISGELYKSLWRRYDLPDVKRHDFVRASLKLVLESPELSGKAMQMVDVAP